MPTMNKDPKARRTHKLNVLSGEKLNADAGLAFLLNSDISGGYTRQIQNQIIRRHAKGDQYFWIPVNQQDGTPLDDKKLIHSITSVVNKRLKASTTHLRIRFIYKDDQGTPINKFLAVPADKYKEIVGK